MLWKSLPALLASAALLPGAASAVAGGEKNGPKSAAAPKVIARFPENLGGHEKSVVIRSAADLARVKGGEPKQLAGQMAKLFKIERIDWDRQMVLVIVDGRDPRGAHVELVGLEPRGKELIVHWKTVPLKPGEVNAQPNTPAALTLLVERFDGPIRFDPPAGPAKEPAPVK